VENGRYALCSKKMVTNISKNFIGGLSSMPFIDEKISSNVVLSLPRTN
jgi:hypothetical protein